MKTDRLTHTILLFLAITAVAQTKLPDTPAGKRVADYMLAFNSGDAARMLEFQNSNMTTTTLQRRTDAERRQMYEQIYADLGALELRRVVEAEADAITVLFFSKNKLWAQFNFSFETTPPHKLTGIGIDEVDSNAPPELDHTTSKPANDTELATSVGAYLDKQTQADEFSGVVLVAKNGKPIFHKAYGFANKNYNAPNQLDTKFNLGSINKTFTKIAIAQLAEQGKLAFDDRLGKHLPDYPNREAAEKVTISQLLSMTSGIGDFFGEKYVNTPKDQIRSIKDYLPLFASEPLLFEPGTSRRYSNGGYVVLGAIIEALSGQDYYSYVRDHIFKPAGLQNTDAYEMDAVVPNLATGYTRRASNDDREEAVRRSNVYTAPGRGSSAGGGYSTAEDLLKFTMALQNGKLLGPEYTQWIFGNQISNPPARAAVKTASTLIKTTNGGLGIAGGAPGINATMEMDVASGYTVIVLSNYDPPAAESVGRQIRSWLP
jgi:CubicO group peptidase (beta-lactamase class C family)